tara:strand:+ start:5604 stop:5936 length:333 start_codon:yes stop_codon:yes gene_type:complete
MKLSQLAAKPQLIEIKIDDESTVTKYGEAVSFWIYDRQDIQTFAKMAVMKPGDFGDAAGFVKDLILDEDGLPVTKDGFVLPTDIMMKTVTKVIEELGKSVAEVSETTTQS